MNQKIANQTNRRQFLTLITWLFVTLYASQAVEPAISQLRAGAATSNITPPLGINIPGGFAPYPAQHVHDELHARCLVVDDGKIQLALVVCDLLGVHRRLSDEARRLIHEKTGIPPENAMISATHTHSSGDTRAWDNRYLTDPPLDEYQTFVTQRIADGVRCAVNLLRPARIGFGTAQAPEHDRRAGRTTPNHQTVTSFSQR